MVQEHDLDTCNPLSGECKPKRRSVETQTECDGGFGVLQSGNGDKSIGAACAWSSGENTIIGRNTTHLYARKLEGGGARSLGCRRERHDWREGKTRAGDNKCLS